MLCVVGRQSEFSDCVCPISYPLDPEWLLTCTQIAKFCTQHLLGKKGGQKTMYRLHNTKSVYIHTASCNHTIYTTGAIHSPRAQKIYIHTQHPEITIYIRGAIQPSCTKNSIYIHSILRSLHTPQGPSSPCTKNPYTYTASCDHYLYIYIYIYIYTHHRGAIQSCGAQKIHIYIHSILRPLYIHHRGAIQPSGAQESKHQQTSFSRHKLQASPLSLRNLRAFFMKNFL